MKVRSNSGRRVDSRGGRGWRVHFFGCAPAGGAYPTGRNRPRGRARSHLPPLRRGAATVLRRQPRRPDRGGGRLPRSDDPGLPGASKVPPRRDVAVAGHDRKKRLHRRTSPKSPVGTGSRAAADRRSRSRQISTAGSSQRGAGRLGNAGTLTALPLAHRAGRRRGMELRDDRRGPEDVPARGEKRSDAGPRSAPRRDRLRRGGRRTKVP